MSGKPDWKPEKTPKKARKPLRRTSLVKTRDNTRQKEIVQLSAQDKAFYMEISDERKHICAYCDNPLPESLSNFNFDHVFEKSVFPHLRHVKEDVVLTCLDCHTVKTAHRYTDRMEIVMLQTADRLIVMKLLEPIGYVDYYSVKNWLIKPLPR
jgi:5-methylcytosine-specific restriction endonuclease McrA